MTPYVDYHRYCWQRLIECSGPRDEQVHIQDDAFQREYDSGLDVDDAVDEWMRNREIRRWVS